MKYYAGYHQIDQTFKSPVVTIGNFDGVHRGHQEILAKVVGRARSLGGQSVAYTFKPHPQIALNPDAKVELIVTYEEKRELLAQMGIDVMIEEPFSRDFSNIKPETFFTEVILRRLGAASVIVGYDFGFGKGREGHLEQLEKFCADAGVELEIVRPLKDGSEVISSSKIRELIKQGNVESVPKFLGRYFSYRGNVVKGDGRGRKIGFPTANLRVEDKIALPNGVYATKVTVAGEHHFGATNVGVRPTFYQDQESGMALPKLVEAHLLDFNADIYGHTVDIHFVKKIRDEFRFSGVESLVAQISQDVIKCREALTSIP